MKSNRIKRSIISILLLAIMLFSTACFSDMDTEKGGVSFTGSISGFKANYRPEEYDYKDFYYTFAEYTLSQLYKIFYYEYQRESEDVTNDYLKNLYKIQNDIDLSQPIDETTADWQNFRIKYFSDIHYATSIYMDEDNQFLNPEGELSEVPFYYAENISWNWDWNIGSAPIHLLSNTKQTYTLEEIKEFYKNTKSLITESITNNVPLRSKLLQTAVIQIILGKEPTVWTSSNISSVDSVLGSASIINGKTVATELLNELVRKGSYVGISDSALDKIKTYILEQVIGAQKFSENNYMNNFSRQDYINALDIIWADRDQFEMKNYLDVDDESSYGNIFDEYPATAIKDYPSNAFFINSEDDKAFEHIEKAEYQSIIVMPSKEQYLQELWFFLASDQELTINYYTRVYNSNTNILSVGPVMQTKTNIETEFVFEDARVCEVGFYKNDSETIIKTQKFNNDIGDGILNTNGEAVPMNYERSKYFTAQPSQNGFGSVSVLNPQKFGGTDGCSFIEIVFDVVKDPLLLDADYSFKIGMFYYGVPSKSELIDFLTENN